MFWCHFRRRAFPRLTYKAPYIYYKDHDNIKQATKTTPKLIGPSFIALQVRDLEASKTFYVEQIGLTASLHNPQARLSSTPNRSRLRSGHRWLTSMQLASWGWGVSLWIARNGCRCAPRATGRERSIHPSSSCRWTVWKILPLSSDPDGYTITVHTESQSRQRQRWTQAADI